jgi:TonB-linked SusC/RagA family outer membrane protein
MKKKIYQLVMDGREDVPATAKRLMRQLLLCAFLYVCGTQMASAQQRKVTGMITDSSGKAVANATVTVKGTKSGVASDGDGRFSINVNSNDAVLVITSVSFKPKEVGVGGNDNVNIVLEASSGVEQEVVVTALGIRRERKSLGYAIQEVKGQTLVDANEPNLANALTGKAAGLQITRSSNGPAGSSKILLRGSNSLTLDNQPLIVVDGVPMSNFTGASNTDYYNPSRDMGNGLSDINAEDIETISVLKGPSAAALYGSRAGSGVIMITTKSGKTQKGLGITVASTFGREGVFTQPEMQNKFGQGAAGAYGVTQEGSWGPKAAGQTYTDWRGQQVPMRIYDNVGNYIDNGFSSNQSVSLQQQMKGTSIYTSFNRLDDKSIIPGAKLIRTNLTARAISKFGKDDRWTADTKIQYINSDAKNRPANGINLNNVFTSLYQMPRSIDIRQLNPPKDSAGRMIWYNEKTSHLNPYWAKQYNLNEDIRDRFLMHGTLKYNFSPFISAQIEGGADKYTTTTESKTYAGSPASNSYSLGKETFTETNLSALIAGHKDNMIGKFGGAFTVGGNLMTQERSRLSNTAGTLVVPDLFSLTNVSGNPSIDQFYSKKKINSVYGTVQVNYDGYLFLDGTFRNDWSSALGPDHRSYFYPSVSASYVISDMITQMGNTLPGWMTYAKVRASWATVGNDMDPYQLYNTYTINRDPSGNTISSSGDILFNPNVVNELIKSYEAGAELRFFQNRFGLDVTVYKSNATNQLINLPLDPLSGYKFKKINAGDVQNKGIEVVLDAKILRSTRADGLNWNATLNFSHNNNTVNYIYPDVPQYSLGGFDKTQVVARAGGKYGEIYGTQYSRVADPTSADNGKVILTADGLQDASTAKQNVLLGNQQASALIGITNSFSYKNFNLSFLVDGRFGGKMFSTTLALMQYWGTAKTTLGTGDDRTMVADGVIETAPGKYEKNTKVVKVEDYWHSVFGGNSNTGVTEANLYDASNVRLRNITLSYSLPSKVISGTPFQRALVGVSCNNVWMISSHMHGLDPESVYATSGNAVGFENSSAPTTRTISFNLRLGF